MASKKVFFATVILIFAVAVGVSLYLFNKQINSQFSQISNYPANMSSEQYTACGCGCCAGAEPKEKCLYRSKGDNLQKIIDEDQKASQSPDCPVTGCSLPVKYAYCD
jgi:hypothetical protein